MANDEVSHQPSLPLIEAIAEAGGAVVERPFGQSDVSFKRNEERRYVSYAGARARWDVCKTSLWKAINGKLPGCEHLPPIIAVKFGARTLIDVASGDAFFSRLPRAATCPAKVSAPSASDPGEGA